MDFKESYKNKYLKYKNKYITLRKKSININLVKENSKMVGGSTDINNFDYLFNEMIFIRSKEKILLKIFELLCKFDNFVRHSEKSVTIVSIGDSPSILLQIYEKYVNDDIENGQIIIKYLPISSIGDLGDNKLLTEKLKRISKYIKTDEIIWIDYVSSGNSFIKFMENLPKDMYNKSKFFIYGYSIIHSKDNYKKIMDNTKILFHKIDKDSLFYTFTSSIIGNSEKYEIRCVKRSEVDDKYKATIHDSSSLPMKDTLEKETGQYCKAYAEWLYDQMFNINLIKLN